MNIELVSVVNNEKTLLEFITLLAADVNFMDFCIINNSTIHKYL